MRMYKSLVVVQGRLVGADDRQGKGKDGKAIRFRKLFLEAPCELGTGGGRTVCPFPISVFGDGDMPLHLVGSEVRVSLTRYEQDFNGLPSGSAEVSDISAVKGVK